MASASILNLITNHRLINNHPFVLAYAISALISIVPLFTYSLQLHLPSELAGHPCSTRTAESRLDCRVDPR
jgi:hypothetical protein